MKIRNLTNAPRELNCTVMTKDGIREISIYVKGNSVAEIDQSVVVKNLQTLLNAGAIEIIQDVSETKRVPPVAIKAIVDKIVKDTLESLKVEKPAKEETLVDNIVKVEEPAPEVEAPTAEEHAPDEVVCEICGDPFKTNRGLQMHMRVKHPEVKEV